MTEERLRAALLADVTALAHLKPEEWDLRRGADPIARTINAVRDIINARFDPVEPKPDHRMCQCGHVGSVHEGEPRTSLGYAVCGQGWCHGSTDGGKKCPCRKFVRTAAALSQAEPNDD